MVKRSDLLDGDFLSCWSVDGRAHDALKKSRMRTRGRDGKNRRLLTICAFANNILNSYV
jgi:hypothetical protein